MTSLFQDFKEKKVISIKTEDQLGKALKEGKDIIEIEGDLVNKVIKIKATGKIAWAVAIIAIALAVLALLISGGVSASASGIVEFSAVSILGLPTTLSAISIAVAAGGVGVLNSSREYEIESQTDNLLLLKRK